jgi:hypothetical protein
MRFRRTSVHSDPSAGDNVSAVNPAFSPSMSDASTLQARRTKELSIEDAALCDEHAIRLRSEAEDRERWRPLYWRTRCAPSALIALLIWMSIGFVVYQKIKVDDAALLAQTSTPPATAESMLPDGCRGDFCLKEGGTEAFGAVLGASDGVYAYSNCYAHSCISFLDYEYPIPLPPGAHTALDDPQATTRVMRTGMKWQCVEYARRYWMLRGTPVPAVFGPVDGAADIWNELTYVTLLDNVTIAPLFKYANGVAVGYGGSAPRRGDLIIYPRDDQGKFPYGHVAVIVSVELPDISHVRNSKGNNASSAPLETEGRVFIAEQNWHSCPWPEPYHNYSRWLPLRVTASSQSAALQYTIHDSYHTIQGWMRYGDP